MTTRHLVLAALTAALAECRREDGVPPPRPGRLGAALWPVAVGLGWRQRDDHEAIAAATPGIDFLELRIEDFLAPSGAIRQRLLDVAGRLPVSLQGVSLGLGSAAGIDWQHLKAVRALVEAVKPGLVSEPACFNRVERHHAPMHAHALLPIPFSERGLSLLAAQVDTVQQTLGRQILLENLATCVAWDEDAMREAEFFNALVARTGCGLLLDLTNLQVNALNRGRDEEGAVRDCLAWLDEIDSAAVGQYHVAGRITIDGRAVAAPGRTVDESTWAIYRHALGRIGARPTLIERDGTPPPMTALLADIARARREQDGFAREAIAPPPPRPNSRSAPPGRVLRHTVRAALKEARHVAQ
ncbi:DUF692 domain-containing protein [Mitsuaria sp. GD03876]|uniref:DUF692 domain-containing protein n=1 Tax=Mitsuaria sp. GD03876 TaxID=2975399 RepID=UPI00244C0F47|nr:DUF692 domain-containing protein [Mitsuaria sp. GD03876]MDH0866700.1 DUF692 domain-containing protein [Mitsuaria sp. GD03876]